MSKRVAAFAYGVCCYLIFFGTFLYAVGFIGNIAVPKSIDSGPQGPIGQTLLVNLGLLALFAVQHSVMARQGFKRAWTRLIPQPIERSTYVLFSSLALLLLFWQWRPIGMVIWDVQDSGFRTVLRVLCADGWALVLISTFLIDHFDLFGLRRVYLFLRGKPYTGSGFRTPWLYRFIRHPLYFGWLLAFWMTPKMTAAHLVFAIATTGYILLAIWFEERDLVDAYGETYKKYREEVPMIIPLRIGKTRTQGLGAAGKVKSA